MKSVDVVTRRLSACCRPVCHGTSIVSIVSIWDLAMLADITCQYWWPRCLRYVENIVDATIFLFYFYFTAVNNRLPRQPAPTKQRALRAPSGDHWTNYCTSQRSPVSSQQEATVKVKSEPASLCYYLSKVSLLSAYLYSVESSIIYDRGTL